ncbi:cell division protein FtsQ/DivIB [Thermomonospora cellulosilytica]|uniref:Cell division protein FtsQ n=1 Tax=Thermomonospora cellulosilytica TaxID=1411118 RepID=A0A7W3N2Y2_9ACTN|nr:FtsQ-type POTRA domain-containing protein [Thermomonospora cellulosilytica]MBA9006498.1 cell division protein FtsQ [Thermomonospora cellulosilytica]
MAQTQARRGRAAAPAAQDGRRPRWRPIGVTLLVLALLAAATWVLLGSRLLVVRQVEVSGTELVRHDRLVAAAGVRLGLPLARLDTDEVRARVQRIREVESATVRRVWPGTVRIEVRERVPLVAVERAGRFWQIDRFGVTVTESAQRPAALPVLNVAAPRPGDPATDAALRVVQELPERLARRLTAVDAPSPESVTLRLAAADGAGPLTVVWGPPGRAEEKSRLVEALRRTPAGRSARTIDVSSPEVVTTR